MSFDSGTYWKLRGESYEARFRPERYREQEEALARLVEKLDFDSVLDVGCGFGRIGELVLRLRPGVEYVGLDISPHQLAGARRRLPGATFIEADVRSLPDVSADLVLAIEVLMHQPPGDVLSVVQALRARARHHLVTLDWSYPLERPVKAPDFLHDYRALLPDATEERIGYQALWHVRT